MVPSTLRVAAAIQCAKASFTSAALERFKSYWNIKCPSELVEFWKAWGSGHGFVGKEEETPFIMIYSPEEALYSYGIEEVKHSMPEKFAPFGNDGSREMIVYMEGQGYGLLPLVHEGQGDAVLVAKTLEGFFQKTERDEWEPKDGDNL